MAKNKSFPIVAIGSSAGGLNALIKLIKPLPADTGMAFVVVTHMAPAQESNLSAILSRSSKIPIKEISKNEKIKPNNIYVMAPNTELNFSKGQIEVIKRTLNQLPTPIDRFFISVVKSKWEQVIGVVLSGQGADGSFGIREIKNHGGITFAQDPNTTEHSSMPLRAISTGVDFVLSPEDIAAEIQKLSNQPDLFSKIDIERQAASEDNQENSTAILNFLSKKVGVDFTHYKQSTIIRRIQRRMMLKKLSTFSAYISALKEDPAEVENLFDDLLIKVTNFYRDSTPFRALEDKIFPEILKKKSNKDSIRIWIPGCSTGEETYSIAISLFEAVEKSTKSPEIQIFSTDLSEKCVKLAREGIYPESAIAELSESRQKLFFSKTNHGYQINKSIRDCCVFATQDVTKDPPFSNLDLISCRNLLIYFDPVLQKSVIPLFHYALRPEGCLLLGSAESITSHSDLFQLVDKKNKIYTKKFSTKRPQIGIYPTTKTRSEDKQIAKFESKKQIFNEKELTNKADHVVLSRLAPAGFLVNEDFDIIQFRGITTPYVEIPHGNPNNNLLKIIKEELKSDLRKLTQEAKKRGPIQSGKTIRIGYNGSSKLVRLHATPLRVTQSPQCFFLIIVRELIEPKSGDVPPKTLKGKPPKGSSALIEENLRLERELQENRENTQSIFEEQESTNEELKSANEEIISSNEELQSTNEELETAKEELQSSNEELNTVNDELRNRSDALTLVNDDLLNVIASSRIPLVILGRDLKIRRYSPSAEKLFRLIPTDVGRPINDIKPKFDLPNLKELALEVIDSIKSSEHEVCDEDGVWYSIQFRPFLTTDHKIAGVVLSCQNIDANKKTRDQLRNIFNAAPNVMILVDKQKIIQQCNFRVEEIFGYETKEIIGKPFEILVPAHKKLFQDFTIEPSTRQLGIVKEISGLRKNGTKFPVEIGLSQMHGPSGTEFIAMIVDVTKRKRDEKQLREEVEKASQLKTEFLANVSHEIRTPLTAIVGFSQKIAEQNATSETHDMVEIVKRNAKDLQHLINDILDLSKVEAGKIEFEKTDFSFTNELAEVYISLKRQAAEKSIGFNFYFNGPIPEEIFTDPIRFRQILTNVAGNAIKFTSKGSIDITVSLVKSKDSGKKNLLQLLVKDSGRGISESEVDKLFKAFSQVDTAITKEFGGTGLGLALSRHLARALGGDIVLVQSTPEEGSTFSITIDPGSMKKVEMINDLNQTQLKITVNTISEKINEEYLLGMEVLLAEDSPDLQLLTESLLKSRGAKVEIAANGQIAVDKARGNDFDLILMDIQMPVLDGYKATSALREGGYEGPIVALTARLMKEELDKTLAAGCNEALSKPIDQKLLFETVKRYQRGEP